MDKNIIKELLRETFVQNIDEARKVKPKDTDKKEENKKSRKEKKEYAFIKKAFRRKRGKTVTMAGVMQAAGLGDASDATDRSLFRKKVFQEKNEDGSTYQFDDDERDSVITILNRALGKS